MKTLLVTGSSGFVGANLGHYMKNKYRLLSLDLPEKHAKLYDEFYIWERLDGIPDEIDTVIHLAGKAHDTKNRSNAQSYFDVNTGLTQKIFDWFLQSKAEQFIFFSSVKAVADTVDADFLTEDVIPRPVGPYGESKMRAEQYILSRNHCGKKVYILRPCMIHGPGNKGNLNMLYNVVKHNIPYPLGAFDNRRSFLNIWNLSWIMEQIIVKSPESGIYHLADDEPVSTNTLIRLIAESRGKKARIWKPGKSFIKFLARTGNVCGLPLNTERLRKLTENYIVSNRKIMEAIGAEKLPVKAEEGLLRTLKSFNE